MERPFLTPEDVAEDTGLSLDEARELIKQMAKQLRSAGYLAVIDRVQKAYYEKQKSAGFLVSGKKAKEYVPLCDKRLLNMWEFCSYASIGKDKGMELAEAAGAVFRAGRRVMVDRVKFDKWCDENTGIAEEE